MKQANQVSHMKQRSKIIPFEDTFDEDELLATLAHNAAKAAESSSAFMAICGIALLWMATGPLFHWSDTWRLVINTGTKHREHADGISHSEHSESGKLCSPAQT
ncbi:MAG: low affinity iron permease family protein [Bryobacteraceae bacterium]